jgi:hypothetical protein
LKDHLVGHSVIPDMVDEIGRHMQTLDARMTAPARNAVVNTARVIETGTFAWNAVMDAGISQMNFAWGSFTQTIGNGFAQMTQGAVNWSQMLLQVGLQTMSALITFALQTAAQWVISEAMRASTTVATNATIVGSNTAAATVSTATWGGAASAILGMFGTISGGFAAIATTLVGIMTAVGTYVMGVLSAIAEALADTIFGIPWALAIIVGVVAIAAALAATGNIPGLAQGGIKRRPGLVQFAEAGPEAAIPLNSRGAAFMSHMLGLGGGGRSTTIIVELDGRPIVQHVANQLPSILRLKGVPV